MDPNAIQTALQSSSPSTSQQLFSVEEFDDIELTEEEAKEALRQARRAKHYRIRREEYEAELAKPIELKKFTPEQIFALFKEAVTYNEKEFLLDNEQYVKLLKNLCCYFAGDMRFKGDLRKGLMLMGNVGTGKTALMKAFQHNQIFSFRVVSILEIVEDYKEKGEGAVRHYKNNSQGTRDEFGKETFGLCIDDIGVEEIPAAHFSQRKNVFAEILQLRSLNVPPKTTHVTTNKTPEELAELYGTRVYDRMKEMFNVIAFNGIESFRK